MNEFNPRVTEIYLAPNKGVPMEFYSTVMAEEGKGLIGDDGFYDRYAAELGAFSRPNEDKIRHVTIISQLDIAIANQELEAPFLPRETRRNILIDGIRAADLLDVRFRIGRATLKGVSICDPCARPDKLANKKGFRTAFYGENGELAGIRAAVLATGRFSIGDAVVADL